MKIDMNIVLFLAGSFILFCLALVWIVKKARRSREKSEKQMGILKKYYPKVQFETGCEEVPVSAQQTDLLPGRKIRNIGKMKITYQRDGMGMNLFWISKSVDVDAGETGYEHDCFRGTILTFPQKEDGLNWMPPTFMALDAQAPFKVLHESSFLKRHDVEEAFAARYDAVKMHYGEPVLQIRDASGRAYDIYSEEKSGFDDPKVQRYLEKLMQISEQLHTLSAGPFKSAPTGKIGYRNFQKSYYPKDLEIQFLQKKAGLVICLNPYYLLGSLKTNSASEEEEAKKILKEMEMLDGFCRILGSEP